MEKALIDCTTCGGEGRVKDIPPGSVPILCPLCQGSCKIPAGVALVDFRGPSAAERQPALSLEPMARKLLRANTPPEYIHNVQHRHGREVH